MARNRGRGASATATATDTLEPEEGNGEVTVSTDVAEVEETTAEADIQFEFSVKPAPDDYQPERKTPGRTRRPCYFDDVLRRGDVWNMGWQEVPADSPEHKAAILRELNRAKLFLNGPGLLPDQDLIGLDLDDKQDHAVFFKSRKAQTRERKATNGETAEGETDGDTEGDEVEADE